ncbi:SGNH/GDSL hydrolase family protein [Bradyrhizobium sp. OAE829]|uniref:SGNH/GDSL hydrolase family protein n=1 Tax=Bradyrhizobium sp. OAE829 TaxID=2663807 RepID=UPI0017892378
MNDVSRTGDPDIANFKYKLPHLTAALQRPEKIKIVAIGSSSTAGVAPVAPYPPRLEMLLRQKLARRTIDVLNRGVSGEEAPKELERFRSDVFDEAPALVIWQVGTNAIFHDMDRREVASAIESGLRQLADLSADVILMDLQYTRAMTDKLKASEEMVAFIAAAAEIAKVNVFQRFALMRRWVDDSIPISTLQDGADNHLHVSEWATGCLAEALSDAIARAVKAAGTT